MKIDNVDKKLLTYLYQNFRGSVSKIAKECDLTKEQVSYRMQKYESEKIILKYATLYNYSLLKKPFFAIVWISCKDKEKIRLDLENTENILTYGDMLSKWDLFVNCIYNNIKDFEIYLKDFLGKHGNNIIKHDVFIVTYLVFFDLKTFYADISSKMFNVLDSSKTELNFSDNDIKTFKLLEHKGRIKIVDLANKLNLSSTAVMKNLRKYKDNEIILGTRAILNMEKLGFFWAEIHCKFNLLDTQKTEDLIKFCKFHSHINALTLGIGDINCIIQVFFDNTESLRDTIKDIKKKYNQYILDFDVILTENEGDVKTLPFYNEFV